MPTSEITSQFEMGKEPKIKMPKQNPSAEPNDTSSAKPYDGEPGSQGKELQLWAERDCVPRMAFWMLETPWTTVPYRSLHTFVFQMPKKETS